MRPSCEEAIHTPGYHAEGHLAGMGVMTIQVGAIESESNTRYTAPKAIDITTSPRMMAVITPPYKVGDPHEPKAKTVAASLAA